MVEFKFLFVEAVHSLHVFHAALEDLHLLLELNLLLGLIVGVLGAEVFQLLGVGALVLVALVQEVLLEVLVLLEERLDLGFVLGEDLRAFQLEGVFDLAQMVGIVLSHHDELLTHLLEQFIDVVLLHLHGLHVLIVLKLELLHELADKGVFLVYNSFTGVFLLLDVLRAGYWAGAYLV